MIRQNRLIAAILSAVLVFSMVPSGVLAAEETVDSSRMEIESEGNRQSEETEADMSVSEYEEDSAVLTEAAEGAGDDAALSGAAADEGEDDAALPGTADGEEDDAALPGTDEGDSTAFSGTAEGEEDSEALSGDTKGEEDSEALPGAGSGKGDSLVSPETADGEGDGTVSPETANEKGAEIAFPETADGEEQEIINSPDELTETEESAEKAEEEKGRQEVKEEQESADSVSGVPQAEAVFEEEETISDTAQDTAIEETAKEQKEESDEGQKQLVQPEMTFIGEETADEEEQYEEFLNAVFYGAGTSDRSGSGNKKNSGSYLTGPDKLFYTRLAEAAGEIVRGERDSGLVEVPLTEITGGKIEFTALDLGLDYIVDESGSENPGIAQALSEKFPMDFARIQTCLLADCAYEMFPLKAGIAYQAGFSFWPEGTGNDSVVHLRGEYYIVGLNPIQRFADPDGDEFAINSDKIREVLYAADNARRIVSNAEGMSDYYKLNYYKEKICDLVSYDEDARAQGLSYDDQGAWALLNVFDGDDSTNVVCEGYAEAFQYLCELTTFEGDTYAYSVTGNMAGGTGEGGHKWNIVHIDGNNYIADITNSDQGSAGEDGKLFLKGMEGSVEDGYTKEWPEREVKTDLGNGSYSVTTYPGGTISFVYDDDTKKAFEIEDLTLSGSDYDAPEPNPVDDRVMIKGVQVHLTDKVGLIVYVKPLEGSDLAEDDYMEFLCNDEMTDIGVGEPGCRKLTITDYTGEDVEVYAFEYDLWIKQMADEVSFRMVIGGEEGTEKTYSVKDYAEEILRGSWYGNYSEKEKELAKALLNLGGYAQEYFGYNTDHCANDSIDRELGPDPDLSEYKYTLTREEDNGGFHLKQATLLLGTYISLLFTYETDEGKGIEDFDILIDGCDISTSKTTPAGETIEVGYNDVLDKQCMVIGNIEPYRWNEMHTLKVRPKGQSQVVCTLSYGPLSYCYSKLQKGNNKLKNLCTAIYKYWETVSGE